MPPFLVLWTWHRIHILILTGVQNGGGISRLKNGHILISLIFEAYQILILLKLNFRDEGDLYSNCLFYILTNNLRSGSKRAHYQLTNDQNLPLNRMSPVSVFRLWHTYRFSHHTSG